jgi:hypothetical protein
MRSQTRKARFDGLDGLTSLWVCHQCSIGNDGVKKFICPINFSCREIFAGPRRKLIEPLFRIQIKLVVYIDII